MSLYADLGVDPAASRDELRKAHRKAVSRTHPDKGGNREDFEKVQHAYLILRDPKSRQRYDETGEHDARPDNELAEIGTILVGAFDQAMTESSGRFAVSDLIASTRALLARRKADAANQRKILDEAIQNFTKVRDRLSFKGGGCGYPRLLAQCQDCGGPAHAGRIYGGDRKGRAGRGLRGRLWLPVRSGPCTARLHEPRGSDACAA